MCWANAWYNFGIKRLREVAGKTRVSYVSATDCKDVGWQMKKVRKEDYLKDKEVHCPACGEKFIIERSEYNSYTKRPKCGTLMNNPLWKK